jgi:DNA mismatch repair protein MutS2
MTRKHIDAHTLKVLEFEQVCNLLASFATSRPGKQIAAMLYPSVEADWITKRIAETTEMKSLLERNISVPLAGIRDIQPLLEAIGEGKTVFEPAELLDISETLAASGRLKIFFSEPDKNNLTHLHSMAAGLQNFDNITEQINHCIENENALSDDASPKLKEIRNQIKHLEAEIQRRFRAIISSPSMRNAVENDAFLTRNGRAVIALKTDYRHRLKGIILGRSNTGATLYVEPEEMVELDNQLEDAAFAEKTEVGRILWELTKIVLDNQQRILASLRILAFIDLTYAKARFSLTYNMSPPIVRADSFLTLRQARHPLLMHWAAERKGCSVSEVTSEIVPIDVRLGEDFDLLVVTGPNMGGKTVMLKTAGLLTLIAQSGMHIPARADSQIPVYRQVFVDIGDEQSIQQSLSTFSAHINQIIKILTRANSKTLVLLDELGAGTDPLEGAILAVTILDALLAAAGKVIITTHLGKLKSYAYSTKRAENASVQFNVETLQPTYRLLIGTPGSSNALVIAQRLGMPKTVIDKAKTMLSANADNAGELINQVQSAREDAERKRINAQQMLDDAERLRKLASERLAEAQRQQKILAEQADKQIDKTMHQVRKLVEEFAAQMRNAPKLWSEQAERFAAQILNVADSTPLAARHAKFTESLRKGDTVYVAPFRRTGTVYRIFRNRKTVAVFISGREVEVPFAEIWEPDNR